ncbi:MAG: FAD-binding protein [Lachnospiraceae bacterium]|nr:FAD-binding protein [Lachnospiraceae bacterium]
MEALVIGSGIAGMASAVRLARQGVHTTLASPAPSGHSESVMAAGGINATLSGNDEGDSVDSHVRDTLKGGCGIGGEKAVRGLCEHGEEIIRYLESIGTVFSVDSENRPARRAFGGQSHKRTYYCGSSTGKQIVSALIMEARRFEASGMITRRMKLNFHSALIKDGVCYGALLMDSESFRLEAFYSDFTVMATGGQNALFGKTTGSTLCDGYAAGKLFMQGAELKNLEFIQYHPTTLETAQKKMLISEAVRGEGGRLFFVENGKRVYFMEEKYGEKGNLMTRDLISREIYGCGKDVFLDISFLEGKTIDERLPEVRDLCMKYRSIDIKKEPIPVSPSVHFFMGGLAVHLNHETSIKNLFATGECASMYHGANRLGGNSLLSAMYSGLVASDEIAGRAPHRKYPDFSAYMEDERKGLKKNRDSKSTFPVFYIRDMLSKTMNNNLGIVRCEKNLDEGLSDIDYYLSIAEKIRYDRSVPPYTNFSLKAMLTLAGATIMAAKERRESRGAHYRSDHRDTKDEYAFSTIVSYDDGGYSVRFDKEHSYES